MRNPTKKFAGKRFELVDETDDFEEAQQQAKKLRDSGHLARVEVRRYCPPWGAEYNTWKVWARKKAPKK